MLRGQPGRNPVDNDDTTRHLSGRSVRVSAFGLALLPLASRMTTRERAAGNSAFQTHRTFASILGSVLGLCYFLCYFWGRNLGPWRQSEKTDKPIQPVHYQWFMSVASDGVQPAKIGKSEFLSPVRLPFRHSGTVEKAVAAVGATYQKQPPWRKPGELAEGEFLRCLSMNPHLTLTLSPPMGWERRGNSRRTRIVPRSSVEQRRVHSPNARQDFGVEADH